MKYRITTQKELRAEFWQTFPNLPRIEALWGRRDNNNQPYVMEVSDLDVGRWPDAIVVKVDVDRRVRFDRGAVERDDEGDLVSVMYRTKGGTRLILLND